MRAHAAADDGGGHPEDRPADARPAENSGLAGHRPVDADAANDRGDLAAEERPADVVAAPAHAVNPLQRLIAARLQERGWSYGEVARRSGLPRSTVYTLATTRNLVRPPRPATINGLAKGLDVPASAVRAAAAESTGMHYYDEPPADPGPGVPGDQERELLIASIDELSVEDRRHVAALVESLRNRPAPPGRAEGLLHKELFLDPHQFLATQSRWIPGSRTHVLNELRWKH
jgi:transcriptional regulator with XRE-family HTH domain